MPDEIINGPESLARFAIEAYGEDPREAEATTAAVRRMLRGPSRVPMEIVRVFVSMPNGTIYESDSDHRQNVVAAGVRQRPSQKWWSGPTDVPRVYYQKKDPDDRGPVVTPDFAKVERERMAREIRERELGRRAMLRFNRHRVRNLLMRNTMAKELAEERLADVRRAEMFAQPTGRHDPNPYESDSTAREYDQLVDRRDGTRVTLIQRDREVAVASINYARSIMHFAKRLVLSMPIDEAIDALKAVRANRAFPPQADPLDEWDAAMRSPNFIGYLQATHGKRSRDITLLQQEERLYKARVNIWYAEQEARREAEESERHAQECDPFAAYVGARDVFGDPIPRPVPVRQPATLDAGRRHNMHIRHTITVATKLIPAFAHQKTKLLLTRLGWFYNTESLIQHMYQTKQLWQDSDERIVREFLAEHVYQSFLAHKALLESLDSKQLDTVLKHDYFDVLANQKKLRYRIRLWAPHQNVFLLDDDRMPVLRLCGYLPQAHISATHLVQKMTLDMDYTQMHRQANETKLQTPVPINEGFGLGPLGLPELTVKHEESWCQTMAAPRWEAVERELLPEEREELNRREAEYRQRNANNMRWFEEEEDDEDEYYTNRRYRGWEDPPWMVEPQGAVEVP